MFKNDCFLAKPKGGLSVPAKTPIWTLWLHTHCSPLLSIVRWERVWSLPRSSSSKSTQTTTRNVVAMACAWLPWPGRRSVALPSKRASWSARSSSVTLTSTTNLEDRPSTRSIHAFPLHSNEALESSWLPASVPADRWLSS